MGLKTELKSREKFKEVLQSDFEPTDEFIMKLSQAARRIGGICKSIRPSLDPGCTHISVTSSGELEHAMSAGGQASAVREALDRILLEVPTEDRVENTPFGQANHIKGIPLWKTLFRDEPLSTDKFFMEEYSLIKEQPGRFVGLDSALGRQLMYVAWRELTPNIVLRATVAPEMGNKARHVTLSDYYLNLLMSPLSHLLIEAMKFHPAVFSSFHRQDQAWEAVKGLCRQRGDISLPPGFSVLSSDLKDATNAQQWKLTQSILRAFISGAELSFRPDYVNLVLGLIGPRYVMFSDQTTIVSKVGIMMGEAIAKPSLTLLNLAIEELSFLQYTRREDLLLTGDPAPNMDWRYLHIGGDDHLAYGPDRYLDRITQNHFLAGSHISAGQHGYSRVAVRYTERVLNLNNLCYKQPFHKEDYSKSIIVDSVKVRLLERGLSTMIEKDNKNVAIGKSRQLGGTLEWLPKDNRFYTESKKISIQALFVLRMGPLLPSRAVNPRAFAAMCLPHEVGGFGLGFKSQMRQHYLDSPAPTRALINKLHLGLDVSDEIKVFRSLNSNMAARGVSKIFEYREVIASQLRDYPSSVDAIGWKELQQKFPDPNWNARKTLALAADSGYLSIDEYAERVTRGNLFQALLMESSQPVIFQTRPFVQTYKYVVWPKMEDELDAYSQPLDLSNDEIARAISNHQPMWFFDTNQITTFDTGFYDPEDPDSETWEFIDKSYIEGFSMGLPSLYIAPRALGLRVNRR
jgi:hypothetical protein